MWESVTLPLYGRILYNSYNSEYKQSGMKIITLYSRSILCTFHLCSDFVTFFWCCSCRGKLHDVPGRILRLVRKETLKEIKFYVLFSIPFFSPSTDVTNKKRKKVDKPSSSPLCLSNIYFRLHLATKRKKTNNPCRGSEKIYAFTFDIGAQ